jgi:antitoxin ParD1/3/4
MSVDLGTQLESVVEALVKNGRYGSKSEVLREGVRLVQEREARIAELDAALDEGLEDIRAGRTVDADEVFDRLERELLAQIDDEDRRVAEERNAAKV